VNNKENVEENYDILCSPKSELNNCKSHCLEAVSFKSEDKYVEEAKEVQTIQTSESSSIK